jgi:pSer/pThr/pTyr-binding forkhead associated (FHA) protein
MSGTLVLVLRLGLALCLYAFLGWGLFTLWRDLQARGLNLAGRRVPSVNLTIQRGHGETTRRVFQLAEITLGRDPACDLPLDDDAISARHARLSYHHGQWWAEDLGSTNGTRLNQALLATPTVITSGDQIECGHTALVVSIGASAETSPTIRL